jgi:hypothetical protein
VYPGRPEAQRAFLVPAASWESRSMPRPRLVNIDSIRQFVYNVYAPEFQEIRQAGRRLPGRPGLKAVANRASHREWRWRLEKDSEEVKSGLG